MRVVAAGLLAAVLVGCSPAVDRRLPDPVQRAVAPRVLDREGRVVALARFTAEVVVLRREDYAVGDAEDPLSGIAPTDLAVGWGDAGLARIRDSVSIAQGRRRYGWSWWSRGPVPAAVRGFGVLSANWHMVPSGPGAADELGRAKRGRVVAVSGWLVRIRTKDGAWATSSLRRDDSGDGACEIVWVESVRPEPS